MAPITQRRIVVAKKTQPVNKVRLSKHQRKVMTALARERDRLQRELQDAIQVIGDQVKEYAKGYKLDPELVRVEGDDTEVWLIETQPEPSPEDAALPEPEENQDE